MPTLYILGGANGVGKTSWYNFSLAEGFIDPNLPFINVDIIARQELGEHSTENFAKADAIARSRLAGHFEKRENFMIESNLARNLTTSGSISLNQMDMIQSYIFSAPMTLRSIR